MGVALERAEHEREAVADGGGLDGMTALEEYLRERLAEALAMQAVYGTSDPDEIARRKAEGPKCRGILEDYDGDGEPC